MTEGGFRQIGGGAGCVSHFLERLPAETPQEGKACGKHAASDPQTSQCNPALLAWGTFSLSLSLLEDKASQQKGPRRQQPPCKGPQRKGHPPPQEMENTPSFQPRPPHLVSLHVGPPHPSFLLHPSFLPFFHPIPWVAFSLCTASVPHLTAHL